MKLKDINDCIETLNLLFNRQLDFEIAEKLCDLFFHLEEKNCKYKKLIGKFLNEYYVQSTETDTYEVKDKSKIDIIFNEKLKIDQLEYVKEKEVIPKIEKISPKELFYLKEFFIFE